MDVSSLNGNRIKIVFVNDVLGCYTDRPVGQEQTELEMHGVFIRNTGSIQWGLQGVATVFFSVEMTTYAVYRYQPGIGTVRGSGYIEVGTPSSKR